jgi:structural maintenance of chromosome 1
MRNQRAGQATFIPLDTIQVQPIQEKYRNFVKGARLAIDVIQCDTAVARAVQHACGSSLICDTLDIAKHVRYDLNQEVKGECHISLWTDGSSCFAGRHCSPQVGTNDGRSRCGPDTQIRGGRDHKWVKKMRIADLLDLNRIKEKYISELAELAKSRPRNKADEALQDKITRIDVELTIAKDDLVRTLVGWAG